MRFEQAASEVKGEIELHGIGHYSRQIGLGDL